MLRFIALCLFFALSANAGTIEDEVLEALRRLSLGSERSEDGDDNLPRYVLLILSRDTFAGEDVESDGESDDEFNNDDHFEAANADFTEGQFEEAKFKLTDLAATLEEVRNGPQVSERVRALALKLAEQAFGREAAVSIAEARARMKVVVLSNRVKSISRSRRYVAHANPTAPVNVPTGQGAHIEVAELHYHLVPRWREHREGGVYYQTDVNRVATYFRALKRWEENNAIDLEGDFGGARRFRKHFEDNIRAIVPFHSLRNALKNHRITVGNVVHFLGDNAAAPVYLAFFDDDFDNLRAEGRGLFSVYDDTVMGERATLNRIPSIMSTGYRFGTQDELSVIASEIDRLLRSATASVLPSAPCFPEPNFLILAHLPRNILCPRVVDADFDVKMDGKSKTESRSFIKAAFAQKDAAPETTRFLPYFPMHTTTPPRVEQESKKLQSKTSAEGRLQNWGEPEIKFLRSMSQSHLMPRDWAQGVVAAVPLSNVLRPGEFGLPADTRPFHGARGQSISKIATSAVARMFNAYLPIAPILTDTLSTRSAGVPERFRAALLVSLLAYSVELPVLRAVEKVSQGNSVYAQYLRATQTTNNMDQLRRAMANIFATGAAAVQNIEEAARRSGQAVRDAILYYFDFGAGNEALTKVRRGLPLYAMDHMDYEYTDGDVWNMLWHSIGAEGIPEDHPNEAIEIGEGAFLLPPIGGFAEDGPEVVLTNVLQEHLLAHAAEEQTIAIPYHLGAHWVGLVIKVETKEAGGRRVRVRYIDSIDPDPIVVEELREVLERIFTFLIGDVDFDLREETMRLQTDLRACGPIMVENILDALVANRPAAPEVMTPDLTMALRASHIQRLRDLDLALEGDGPVITASRHKRESV